MALNVGRTIAIFEIGEVGVFSARRYDSAVIGYGPTCLCPCVHQEPEEDLVPASSDEGL